mgnify:CR=1 FL=1
MQKLPAVQSVSVPQMRYMPRLIKPFLLSHGNSPFLRDKRFRPRHVECVPVYVYKLVQTTFRYN